MGGGNTYNARVRSAKIEAFIDPENCGVDNTFWPTKGDFTTLWKELSEDQRHVVAACVSSRNFGEVLDATCRNPAYISSKLRNEKKVGRAILMSRMCQLPSDTAKALFLESFIGAAQSRKYYFEEIQKIIKTDRDHLKELASKLVVDGDGKRNVLKEIVAYGMQVKKLEDAIIDVGSGVELSPMVVGLADARMAFNALQELNRMDHEYGQDDKATSSIESQATRIKRLKDSMNKEVKVQAKRVDAVAKSVATRELKMLSDMSDKGV